jgi:hypothetical protein
VGDAVSLRWLAFLPHRPEGLLATGAGGARGRAGGEAAPLDELVSDPSLLVIRASVVSDAGVAQLVERALGKAPDAEFLTALAAGRGQGVRSCY